jgi:DNA polymerase III gamma/tau subunit
VNLYEQFRPRSLSEFVGQPKAHEIASAYIRKGMVKHNAFWITGPTGTGKTSLARIMAESIADDFSIEEVGDGSELTVSDIQRMADNLRVPGWTKGGRALIVNEAHGLKPQVFQQLRGFLETMPLHAAWFFTTTTENQAELFERTTTDQVLSRCVKIRLTNQGFAAGFASRLSDIARQIGLSLTESEAIKIMRDTKNNARDALEELQTMYALA